MAEYQEAYSVSGLKGAPPGYVGYGRGGILTEAVRRNPYTAVLLDEAEKAHPDVLELFEQVFDKGTIEDSEGLVVDFRNTLILLTTSLGAQTILDAVNGQETPPDPDRLKDQIRPDLLTRFRPSFLSRLVVVPYLPLGDEDVRRVAALKLEKIRRRFLEHQGVQMTWDDGLVTTLAGLSREVDAGARGLDSILAQVILPDLSAELLSRRASGRPCQSVHVRVRPDGRYRYRFDPPTPKAFLPLPLLDPFLPPEEPPAFEEDEEDEPEPVVEPASVEEPPAQPCEPEEVTEAEEPPADQAPVPEPEPEPDEFPPVRPDREEKEGFWRWLWSLFR
jgi:type VI secretion system protein VasG